MAGNDQNKEELMAPPPPNSNVQYVYVAGGGSFNDALERSITTQTGAGLYSLIGGLRQKDFGLHTVEYVACDIREFTARFIEPNEGNVLVDSGGYSFIIGHIPPEKLDLLIDCYAVFVEVELEFFSHVFTLDLPISLKHPKFNTTSNVYEANRASLLVTKDILEKRPELAGKLFFVWQFKTPELFVIWKHLYAELELHRHIRNHAVGGLVGLKKATGIRFSPFTSIAFFALQNYFESDFVGQPMRMHFLGVYSKVDRFHITVLQQLFQCYLDGIAPLVASYDSINPIHTARMNAPLPLYHFVDGRMDVYGSLLDAPEEVLSSVAVNADHACQLHDEMERRCNGQRLHDAGAFSPLNVFSNLQLDRFFEAIIAIYDIPGELDKSSSPTNLRGRLARMFDDIQGQFPGVFTGPMIGSICKSLDRTWHWHRWFTGSRDQATLERYMMEAINEIGFPHRLK